MRTVPVHPIGRRGSTVLRIGRAIKARNNRKQRMPARRARRRSVLTRPLHRRPRQRLQLRRCPEARRRPLQYQPPQLRRPPPRTSSRVAAATTKAGASLPFHFCRCRTFAVFPAGIAMIRSIGWIRYSASTLSPCLVRDLLHGREQILQHAARAEVDFGVDQHAGYQAQALSSAFEVSAVQAD